MRTRIEEEELNIDMSPLIDCVFLLLIFFLVATTLKKVDNELPLDLPEANNTLEVKQPTDFASIGIDAEGSFFLNGNPITISQLQDNLSISKETTPDKKYRLDIDRKAEFIKVMEILDLMRFLDIQNAGINTKK